MDNFKTWLVDVVVKQAGPSFIRGAVLGIIGWVVLKNGVLEPYGVVTDNATHVTSLYWDKLSLAVIALLPALGAWFIKATQVTVIKAVKPKGGV